MKATEKSVAESLQKFRGVFPDVFKTELQFGGCQIELQCNSEKLKAAIEDYFRGFVVEEQTPQIVVHAFESEVVEPDCELIVKQPDPGKTKIKEEYIDLSDGRMVRKRLTGMLFYFGHGTNVAIGPCIENSNQVINFIINRFIQWKLNQDALLFHAAAVSLNGKGFGLSGFSGAGKSTLALHMMNLGVDFVSNDRLLGKIEAGNLQMTGVPKLPRINPGTIVNNEKLQSIISPLQAEAYRAMPLNELWDLEEKYDVMIDEVYGDNKFSLEAEMAGIVVLNWKRDKGDCIIREVAIEKRPELIKAFSKDPGLFYEPDDKTKAGGFTDEQYIELLKGKRVIEISGGVDFESAAAYCYEAIKQL